MAFDADAIVARIRTEAARRLLAAAITLQSAARADVSNGNPAPHDAPAPKGEYPRLRTGQGRAGISVWPASVGEVMAAGSVSVGYRQPPHLYWLAGKGWKGVADTYARERAKLKRILEGNGTP
jgi:hypothetical protein